MRRRAIMVDVDGVLLSHPEPEGWSVHLERDLGISATDIQQLFFRPHWNDVVHGRAAMRERLAPILAKLSPTVTYETFVHYWFSNDAHVDQHLLEDLSALRRGGAEVHLATVQEHERAIYLWEQLDFRGRCDGIHYAAALGCSKPAETFYRSVEARTGLMPESIFFVDDNAENVAGARNCGWTAALWTGRDTIYDLIARQNWHMG